MNEGKRGWHSRGYLPHYDGEVSQFVTFRLFDSLPQGILKTFEIEAAQDKLGLFYGEERRDRIEEYLDRGIGQCFLKKPEIASVVQDALLFQAQSLFQLFAWVVMSNHVHILIRPGPEISLSSIMKGLKGYTSRRANELLNRTGRFWQPDYFDRFIRSREHFEKTVEYIEYNPVKAGLCGEPAEWEFSSASTEDRTGMSGFRE